MGSPSSVPSRKGNAHIQRNAQNSGILTEQAEDEEPRRLAKETETGMFGYFLQLTVG